MTEVRKCSIREHRLRVKYTFICTVYTIHCNCNGGYVISSSFNSTPSIKHTIIMKGATLPFPPQVLPHLAPHHKINRLYCMSIILFIAMRVFFLKHPAIAIVHTYKQCQYLCEGTGSRHWLSP